MVNVLLDHNMPPAIARCLHAIIEIDGHSAYPLREKFPVNIDDVSYFNALDTSWIVISKDLQNARKKAEKAAILRNKIVAFYLSPKLQKQKITEQAAAILWHWDKMLLQRLTNQNGLFQLPENKSRFTQL